MHVALKLVSLVWIHRRQHNCSFCENRVSFLKWRFTCTWKKRQERVEGWVREWSEQGPHARLCYLPFRSLASSTLLSSCHPHTRFSAASHRALWRSLLCRNRDHICIVNLRGIANVSIKRKPSKIIKLEYSWRTQIRHGEETRERGRCVGEAPGRGGGGVIKGRRPKNEEDKEGMTYVDGWFEKWAITPHASSFPREMRSRRPSSCC